MTQANVAPFTHYTTDGIQSTYPYPWYIDAAAEIECYVNNNQQTNFTVTGAGSVGGGNVVFLAPPAAGTLLIRRVTPKTQSTDYVDNDAFSAAAHEAALDKLTRMVQEILAEELSRRPALAVSVLAALRNLTFPSPGALQVIGWNATGTALTTFASAILQVTPDSVAGLAYGKTSEVLTPVGGESSLTSTTSLFPAGSIGLGATYRCTTAFGVTGALTSVDLGDAGLVDWWGSALGITTAPASVSNVGQGTGPILFRNNSAREVVLTANGGTFDATGAAIVTAHYFSLSPDTTV